uniref:hypothetical protein n=1 Tax=Pseudonocardia sp. CA-138482 TaxID=3240023 RepID=UPI003F494EF4
MSLVPDALTEALRIADALGEGWRAERRATDYEYQAALVGPDFTISVDTGGWRVPAPGKLHLQAELPTELREHKLSALRHLTCGINVSNAKTGEQIVRDLRRRLVPSFTEVLAGARKAKVAHDARLVEQGRVVAQIRARLGPASEERVGYKPRSRAHSRHVKFGRYNDPVHAEFEVFLEGDEGLRVELELSREHGVALATFLRGLA